MASDGRKRSPELMANPFVKKRNLEWSIDISPPPSRRASVASGARQQASSRQAAAVPTTASAAPAIEAGTATTDDHLAYFSRLLSRSTLSPFPSGTPRLSVPAYRRLYESNFGSRQGAHFIIHQHDHPIAGTHYDLRIQINETSSASWAIMYGLPGHPNSIRLNRNATETRIHCLWNHLIETASHATGSLLIWDTGTYTVLPSGRKAARSTSQTSSPSSSGEETHSATEQEKLHRAFASRKIRLQLHGTRLPSPYVLNLRLTRDEDAAGRVRSTRVPKTRRRRGPPPSHPPGRSRVRGNKPAQYTSSSASDSDPDSDRDCPIASFRKQNGDRQGASGEAPDEHVDDDAEIVRTGDEKREDGQTSISATEREIREIEDDEVRRTNAYPGAHNSIGSVHQRRWYLSLDRESSGFLRRKKSDRVVWERKDRSHDSHLSTGDQTGEAQSEGGVSGIVRDCERLSYPFYVRGVECERSVITGRLGSDVLEDEGVIGYSGRKGWQPVLK
ncbi:DNA polymerase ligase-domain-containing protein [Xylariaceae sp. FL1272]|nr:DNA polymerase ligase-domain-containing protein [Xylariaceae sp. FL1272]